MDIYQYKTLGEVIIQMAMEGNGNSGTHIGCKLIELDPDNSKHWHAGNLFVAALAVIKKQQDFINRIKSIVQEV